MIFTILGAISILAAVVFLVMFFMFLIFNPSSAVNYLIYVIAFVINGIVFFTLAHMKKSIEYLEDVIDEYDKINKNINNKLDSIESDIIKIKQKLNKKDGE